jgi:hypothetical protein
VETTVKNKFRKPKETPSSKNKFKKLSHKIERRKLKLRRKERHQTEVNEPKKKVQIKQSKPNTQL